MTKTKIHNFVQLSFLQQKYSKLLSITSKLVSSHRNSRYLSRSSVHHHQSSHDDCIGWNFLDSKQRPILSPLTLTLVVDVKPFHRPGNPSTTLNSNRATVATWIDWVGRTQGETKTLHSNPVFLCCLLFGSPFREGKVTCVYPLFSKPRARSHTHRQTPAITSISMTSHWPTPLRFKSSSCWRMTDMCLCECVCERERAIECDENFQFQNGDRRFFATCVFGFLG